MAPDIHLHANLPFPKSLPSFQRLFPNDDACAFYLERIRWEHGFVCPQCNVAGEPFRFANRPGVLRCRKCRRDTALTAGTVMERTRTPLNVWFWAAYLVTSHTAGMSATQFQRQLGLTRYETAFQILHKLRAGMVRPDRLAIRGEGQLLNVYLAKGDSMEGAMLLGSIMKSICERDDSIWRRGKAVMTDALKKRHRRHVRSNPGVYRAVCASAREGGTSMKLAMIGKD